MGFLSVYPAVGRRDTNIHVNAEETLVFNQLHLELTENGCSKNRSKWKQF